MIQGCEQRETRWVVGICALCVGALALAAVCGPAVWAAAARLLRLGGQP